MLFIEVPRKIHSSHHQSILFPFLVSLSILSCFPIFSKFSSCSMVLFRHLCQQLPLLFKHIYSSFTFKVNLIKHLCFLASQRFDKSDPSEALTTRRSKVRSRFIAGKRMFESCSAPLSHFLLPQGEKTDSIAEMKRRAVENCSFPGFLATELTQLPGSLEGPQILHRVMKAVDLNVSFPKVQVERERENLRSKTHVIGDRNHSSAMRRISPRFVCWVLMP